MSAMHSNFPSRHFPLASFLCIAATIFSVASTRPEGAALQHMALELARTARCDVELQMRHAHISPPQCERAYILFESIEDPLVFTPPSHAR